MDLLQQRLEECNAVQTLARRGPSRQILSGSSPLVPQPLRWAPLKHPGEYAVITGCDQKHEQYLPLWYRSFRNHNDLRIYFLDFGLSAAGQQILATWSNTTRIDCRDMFHLHPWYRKSQGILRCQSEHLLWVDLDCVFSASVVGAFSGDGHKICVVDDHPCIRMKVPWMVQAGVIGFAHGDALIKRWAELCSLGDSYTRTLDRHFDLKDQTILSALLQQQPGKRWVLEERFNWSPVRFEDRNYGVVSEPQVPPARLAITHYCSAMGKKLLDKMLSVLVPEELEQQRRGICAGCSLSRKDHQGNFVQHSQCIALNKGIGQFAYKAQGFCPALKWAPAPVPLLEYKHPNPAGRGIIVGCDQRQAWMLPIFHRYLRHTGCRLPLVIADFGLDGEGRKLAQEFGTLLAAQAVSDYSYDRIQGSSLHPMWLKILALLATPFAETIWLDLDILCELDPEGMIEEMGAHTLSVREGVKWFQHEHAADNYHTGAVAFRHGDQMLQTWASWCSLGEEALATIPDTDRIRDEEVFSALVRIYGWQFHHTDPKWCYLIQEPKRNNVNLHYAGPKGKELLRERARPGASTHRADLAGG